MILYVAVVAISKKSLLSSIPGSILKLVMIDEIIFHFILMFYRFFLSRIMLFVELNRVYYNIILGFMLPLYLIMYARYCLLLRPADTKKTSVPGAIIIYLGENNRVIVIGFNTR